MKLTHADTLALLDHLLEKAPKIPRPGGFTVRLKRLRDFIVESGTAEPTLADIAAHVFPGISENSLRTTLAEFRKSLAAAAESSGLRLELIRPDARGTGISEVRCHFTGTPLPRHPEMQTVGRKAVAALDRMHLVRPKIAALTGEELERLTALPMDKDPASGKTIIRFFVSYACREDTLADRLLDRLRRDLNLSKKFFYEFWQDTAIEPGERWHERIQSALEKCDFGPLPSVQLRNSLPMRMRTCSRG